ncbi:hypothetical protein KCU81_g8752, partial [Aureobasidium melanogenum]
MPKHARSRDGCANCKQKRIKCDETRPQCKNCIDRRLKCPGFVRQLKWKPIPAFITASTCGSQDSQETSPGCGISPGEINISGQDVSEAQRVQLYSSNAAEKPAQPPRPRVHSLPSGSEDTLDQLGSTQGPDKQYLTAPFSHQGREVATVASKDTQSPAKQLSETLAHLDDTWLYESTNLASVTDLPGINNTAEKFNHETTQPAQSDPWKTSFSTMPLPNNALLDSETKNALTTHYFDFICQIVSCFDSHESPFRADIPQKMLTCEYIHDCVVGMSAAHLANSVSGMDNIALRHQNRAMFALSSVIDSLFTSRDGGSKQYWLSCSSTRTTRYHALLACLLLNMSSAWYDSSLTGLTHLFGARLLFQAWIVDEGLKVGGDQPSLLTREQSFIVGAMAFLECLASIIIDQPIDVLKYLQPFANVAEGQRIYPNPWTGVSTPLFIILAEVATLIRQKRNLKALSSAESPADSLSGLDEKMNKHAAQLFASALAHRTPARAKMEETKDSKTPLDHLIGMDCIFRFVILLELSQIFPDVVLSNDTQILDTTETQREAEKVALNFAIAALRLISDLPKTSGTLIMLTIPLVSAGSTLQNLESYHCDYNFDSSSFSGLRKDVSDLINQPLPIAAWRDQVELRIAQLERRVGLAPVRRMRELLEAVWRQADETDVSRGYSLRKHVHWMDVMIDEKLETLMG